MKIQITILFVLFSISSQAQKIIGNHKQADKILENIQKFSGYYMNALYDSLTLCYTLDGKIFPNNTKIIEGHQSIQKRWTLPADIKILNHHVTPTEIIIKGKTAYDYGYYEGKTLLADGKTSIWSGKYVIVWKKVKGDWKIYLDIWNNVES